MELILLSDELYKLVAVTKEMMEGIEILADVDCFDLCDILRLHLTTYHEPLPHCQIVDTGVQVNLIYIPYLLISSRPISSNFLCASS